MKNTTILAISAVFVASILAITAFEAEAKPSSTAICPTENVQHWETIAWSGPPIQHPTLPNIDTTFGTVKAQIDPNQAIVYQVVLISRLNELGYTLNGNPIAIDDLGVQQIAQQRHESQIICAEN